jgi:hypothetical protein
MLYYKFRPASEVSFKELLYDELFFTSTEECNDPFDSKSFYEFSAEKDKWKALIKFAADSEGFSDNADIEKVSEAVCDLCPITFDEALKLDWYSIFQKTSVYNEPLFVGANVRAILSTLEKYRPPIRYFSSFSKSCTESLMWSHYASNHQGFCLIFRSVYKKLMQAVSHRKKSIQRSAPKGLAPSMNYALPEGFQFQDVTYVDDVKHISAFTLFPKTVAGSEFSDEEIHSLRKAQFEQYLQKHSCWSYEEESRLVLETPMKWLFGDQWEYSIQERLFRYEPTQLVGVVFGARTKENDKTRIFQILEERNDRIAKSVDYPRIIFSFVAHQATISDRGRKIEVHPLKFVSSVHSETPGDPEFDRLYGDWRDGYSYELNGNRASRIHVPD